MTVDVFRKIGLDVSRETSDRLQIYADLLTKWNRAINLVAPGTLGNLWQRHFLDSAQLITLLRPKDKHWADLGSGGGFPGLIIAILAADLHPALRITLVESDRRKSVFLRQVAQDCGLNTQVIDQRIEDLPPLNADILSARALAPLDQLLKYARMHLAPQGRAIFPKGAAYREEIAAASASGQIREIPSVTDPAAVILCIDGIKP